MALQGQDERTRLLQTPQASSLPNVARRTGLDLEKREKWSLLAGCLLAAFLGTIDVTIVAALVQVISADFGASERAGWLGTSFLLANITFTPLYGRLCDILGRRGANASAITCFLVGTVLCTVAPTMNVLLLGRFIAGIGGGGMQTTLAVVISDLFPLRERALVSSIGGFLWALGGALGGPIGGILSDWLGWRSAFAFQIPLLALSLLSNLKLLNYDVSNARKGETLRDKLKRVDFLGCLSLFISCAAALTSLSLRNTQNFPWSHPLVIVLTVTAVIAIIAFFVVEARVAQEPILPLGIFKRRIPLFVMVTTFTVAVCNFAMMYNLPLYFLTVEGTSASEAGEHLLFNSIGNAVGGFAAGILLHKTGKYRLPAAVLGLGGVLGVGLVASLTPESSVFVKWFGVVPMGFAFIFMLNSTLTALLACTHPSQVATVTGALWLFRTAGQVSGVAVSAAILQTTLGIALNNKITGHGAKHIIERIRRDSSIIATLPASVQQAARDSYAVALKSVFAFCAVFAFLAWLSCIFIPQLDLDNPVAHAKPSQDLEQDDRQVPS
ncbi:hypothetical protein OIO90_001577 [Microbotryomycetes sp. JL221]|nr:hypothetical protein OIO90_001577 [Microbotryomycetes sp. JL221]